MPSALPELTEPSNCGQVEGTFAAALTAPMDTFQTTKDAKCVSEAAGDDAR